MTITPRTLSSILALSLVLGSSALAETGTSPSHPLSPAEQAIAELRAAATSAPGTSVGATSGPSSTAGFVYSPPASKAAAPSATVTARPVTSLEEPTGTHVGIGYSLQAGASVQTQVTDNDHRVWQGPGDFKRLPVEVAIGANWHDHPLTHELFLGVGFRLTYEQGSFNEDAVIRGYSDENGAARFEALPLYGRVRYGYFQAGATVGFSMTRGFATTLGGHAGLAFNLDKHTALIVNPVDVNWLKGTYAQGVALGLSVGVTYASDRGIY